MHRSIDQSAIFTAIKKGVKTALRGYSKMSEEKHPGAIPESYFQAKIADELAKMEGTYRITIEEPYKNFQKNAGGSTKENAGLEGTREVADIVVWEGKDARMIIEMKKMTNGRGLAEDATKIHRTLRHPTSFEGGVLVGIFRSPENIKEIKKKEKKFKEREGVKVEKSDYVKLRCGQNEKNENRETVYAGAWIFFIK